MAAVKKKLSFEQGLKELETMAERMERADLPLEELMKLYKEGVALSETLGKTLEGMKAELRELRVGKDGKAEPASGAAAQTSMDTLLSGEERS